MKRKVKYNHTLQNTPTDTNTFFLTFLKQKKNFINNKNLTIKVL